ncbi:unnamed protein product [Polarella glacialis]|uniref:Uncharacterized protein n=1 Tax=Polarella glacialis TaxID=89957 RepID=A0A813LQE9_POLGL|nr:unnamed protein product [Polarella glacialis]CAE8735704.1 unnamed protein product [Polarella glacialis]
MPPEKRWRPEVAPPSNAEVTVDDWKTHPRLKKHVRRFLDSPDPGRVLSRYSAQAQNVNPGKLLRIAVHVGASVALLPLEQVAASPSGGEEDVSRPSPVHLLAQILRLRGRAKISDWLQGVLHLVALRLQDPRRNVQGQAAVPWIELSAACQKPFGVTSEPSVLPYRLVANPRDIRILHTKNRFRKRRRLQKKMSLLLQEQQWRQSLTCCSKVAVQTLRP